MIKAIRSNMFHLEPSKIPSKITLSWHLKSKMFAAERTKCEHVHVIYLTKDHEYVLKKDQEVKEMFHVSNEAN